MEFHRMEYIQKNIPLKIRLFICWGNRTRNVFCAKIRRLTIHINKNFLVVQNGNAYDESLDNGFWELIKAYWKEKKAKLETLLRSLFIREAAIWQYIDCVRDKEAISLDTWNIDHLLLDRPGNVEI
jgi:hypothetical protein